MATQALLNVQIELGRNTLKAIDEKGTAIRAAFWIVGNDERDWRFKVVPAELPKGGTRDVYGSIEEALRGRSDVLPLHEIYVLSPSDSLIALVSRVVKLPGTGDLLFSGNVIDGSRIPDMYLYRMV